ncbi:MAG TPA: hypothetical protein VNG33_02470, partial [Polyangiaceae bacterium]|nr:hypothetical protein [Polyangiaceae bacterium]
MHPLKACLLFIVAALVLHVRAAAGASSPLSPFPISIASTDLPEIVCVLANAPSEAAITPDFLLSQKTVAEIDAAPWTPPAGTKDLGAWRKIVDDQKAALKRAQEILSKQSALAGAPCAEPGPECSPTRPSKATWHALLCASAPDPSLTSHSLAILAVDFDGSYNAPLKKIYFDGRVVLLDIDAPARAVFTV